MGIFTYGLLMGLFLVWRFLVHTHIFNPVVSDVHQKVTYLNEPVVKSNGFV